MNSINIGRCILQPKVNELHAFSDASETVFGAVVYCKSVTSNRKELTTSNEWNYVPSENNPAGFISRGTDSPKMKICDCGGTIPHF
ncbi:hypothetical protein NPIL_671801 [Nephila pilipes]|uniref:Uncharacterized protein n=1 Tax=Nephila pilipes TaxID=299642 RepID=A0A8X6NU52_NEPPI|nr:hypothetical protein NPIL_671801 [Nephila pilipes]